MSLWFCFVIFGCIGSSLDLSCSKQELLFVVVPGLLIVVASHVAEHGLYVRGLQ